MNKTLLFFVLVLLASCSKSDQTETAEPPISLELPNCIEDMIADPILSEDLKTVRFVELNNEIHYWLNTDFMQVDGFEFIVNNQCDTICSLCGFCVPPPCASDYDNAVWTTIWEK